MKIFRTFCTLLVAFACFFATLGSAQAQSPKSSGPIKVALVLPGRINDPGYYNAGYQALLAVKKKFSAKIAYQENLQPADAEQVLRALAEDGFNYIVAMGGGNYDDAIRDVAHNYPKLRFIIVSGGFTSLPGIVSVKTSNQGVYYLTGILMARMSKTGTIGLIGGRATPPAIAGHVAIIAGARSVRPNIRILDTYTENYENPSIGKEAAIAQIEQGADILYTNADTTSLGVFQAARSNKVLAVGDGTDQNELAPNTILTSAVYGMDTAVTHLIELEQDGPGWENKIYTVDMSTLNIAPFHSLEKLVPADVKATLAKVHQELVDGKITVPTTYAQINMETPLAMKAAGK